MIDIRRKAEAYDHICAVFDHYITSFDSACRKGCADCCTINVVITSLEGYRIAETLEQTDRTHLLRDLSDEYAFRRRFTPRYTLNQLAEKIFSGETVDDEIIDPNWGPCPLLVEDACPIYDCRPFACRGLVSGQACRQKGYALMTPLTVAVNQVMLQYIEHVDAGGFSGNLTDMLRYMRSPGNRRRYLDGLEPGDGYSFISHVPARHLLVEPAEKEFIAPILSALNNGGY